MTHNDNGPDLELQRNGRFYIRPKSAFSQKKHQKFAKRLLLILEKGFSGCGHNMIRTKKLVFVGAQNLGFWPKNSNFAIRPLILSIACL